MNTLTMIRHKPLQEGIINEGDSVKVIAGIESFWLLVTSVHGSGHYTGIVDNCVNGELGGHGLWLGDEVTFVDNHVVTIQQNEGINPALKLL